MHLLYLAITIIGLTCTGFLSKLAQRKKISALDFTTSMFTSSSLIGLFFLFAAAKNISFSFSGNVILLSLLAGIGGSIAFYLFNYSLRIGHYGFSYAIYRNSFIVPIAFSVIFLNDPVKSSDWMGISLIVIAMFLVSYSKNYNFKKDKYPVWLIIVFSSLILSGMPRIAQKMVSLLKENSFSYLFLSYLAGTVLLIGLNAAKKSFNKLAIPYGILAGIASYLGVYFTIKSLDLLPVKIVFPVTLSSPIIITILLSSVFFKEKLKIPGFAGILLGIAGIVLLYLLK